jgi:chromosomal replication initiation ATPase DnaA
VAIDSFLAEPSASAPRRDSQTQALDRVVGLVANELGVAKSLILHHSRCRVQAARARQIAMYLTHVVMGQSLSAVGMAFGRDRTTVSYACALIEDMRDDQAFDAELDRYEALLLGAELTHG